MLESNLKKWFKDQLDLRINYWLRIRDQALYLIEPKTHKRSAPDLIILGPGAWAAIEFKRGKDGSFRPNQLYNIRKLNGMGYANFVDPENAEEVLDELEELFGIN